jgi:hypothetical protein
MKTKMETCLGAGLAMILVNACGDDDRTPLFDSASASAGSTGEATASADDTSRGSQDGTTSDGSADGTVDDSTDGGLKLDVGSEDPIESDCDCDLSYLWVADHSSNTSREPNSILKINTKTLQVEGRFLTRPDGGGNPSRTSVNLVGDVVVANRHGGLTKFYADVSKCQESNGMPGIQTSTDDQALSWADEECRAWHVDVGKTNQRPVAWTGGTQTGCDATGAKVWTVTTMSNGFLPGTGGSGATAYLIDGDTGAVEQTIDIPDFNAGGMFGLGPYGAAVDADGNLYFTPNTIGQSNMHLARVDRVTFEATLWTLPVHTYGITVDHAGRVWTANTLGSFGARFDPDTETWDTISGFGGGSGLTQGPDSRMYLSIGSTVRAFDVETMQEGLEWSNDQTVKGVSFDADGYLWAVTYRGSDDNGVPNAPESFAHKIDPATMTTVGSVSGLRDPYTYSDMTGNVLHNVACVPAG